MKKIELEIAKQNFIIVRNAFLKEDNGTSWAYRMAFKMPWRFYREYTPEGAIKILKDKYKEEN